MPNLATVTLIDRKATPVSHVFLPRSSSVGKGICVEATASGSAIGENQLSIFGSKNAVKQKGTLKLAFRKLVSQTVNGITTDVVIGNAYVNIDVTYDPIFTEAERNDIMGQAYSALAPTQVFIHDVLVKGNSVYS